MLIGYVRVSTPEQNIQSQIDLRRQNGCEQIYTDIASGVREDRKGLNDMLAYLREGDTVVVYKTDRIFRSLKNMELFNQRKIAFKSLSEPVFDTSSANGKFVIQIFGAVSEFERNLIKERTRIGIEGARRRNKHLGRPRGFQPETLEKYQFALHLYETKTFLSIKPVSKPILPKPLFIVLITAKRKQVIYQRTSKKSTDIFSKKRKIQNRKPKNKTNKNKSSMNYEQALKEMWAFNEKTPMGANAIALYSFLLKCYSDKKQVVISDYELAKILVKARQTGLTTKNKLRDWGFIDFSAERGKSSVYEFLWKTKLSANNTEISSQYPSWETFLRFAQTQQIYRPKWEAKLKERYEYWQQNNWISTQGKPIVDWKQVLKKVLPLLNNSTFEPRLPKIHYLKLPLEVCIQGGKSDENQE